MSGDFVARVDDGSDRVAGGGDGLMVVVGRRHHRLHEAYASMEVIGGEASVQYRSVHIFEGPNAERNAVILSSIVLGVYIVFEPITFVSRVQSVFAIMGSKRSQEGVSDLVRM